MDCGPRSWHRPPVGARRAVPFLLGHVRPPEEGTARRAPTSKRLASQIEHLADRVIKTGFCLVESCHCARLVLRYSHQKRKLEDRYMNHLNADEWDLILHDNVAALYSLPV